MNANVATRDWDELREMAQAHWDKFTTEDLDKIQGMRDEWVQLIQGRYGYARQRAEQELDQFLRTYDAKIHGVIQNLPGEMDQRLLQYPWISLVTALGVGFILGFLLKPGR
jgi:ElaB/YqjD/DUF883 family membrane-anchored ribosome-binding protein